LRTPVTKLTGSLDLISLAFTKAAVKPSQSIASALQTASNSIKSLSSHVESILDEGSLARQEQDYVKVNLAKITPSSIIRSPKFYLPVSVIFVLAGLLHVVFMQADIYNPTVLKVALNSLLAAVVILGLGVALYFRRRASELVYITNLQTIANNKLEQAKQVLINDIYNNLSTDLVGIKQVESQLSNISVSSLESAEKPHPQDESLSNDLVSSSSDPITSATKLFSGGVDDLSYVVKKVESFTELSKLVPGVVWSIPVASVIASVLQDSRQGALDKNIKIITSAIPTTKLSIEGKKLHYAILAVLNNAINASPEGSSVKLDLAVNNRNKIMNITITDGGSGIDQATREILFSPMNSSNSSMAATGVGLDLSLVKTIMEQAEGMIHIDSQPNEGATVKLSVRLG
ncbi:hypothetical protein KC867_01410, partial [Candidatus Saccharibacteria bacterium]|nr:hypothetical protein [Candidatus Saccharibacteria bacterium]